MATDGVPSHVMARKRQIEMIIGAHDIPMDTKYGDNDKEDITAILRRLIEDEESLRVIEFVQHAYLLVQSDVLEVRRNEKSDRYEEQKALHDSCKARYERTVARRKEVQARYEETKGRCDEAEVRQLDEERRIAGERAEQTRPLTLWPTLKACHSFNFALRLYKTIRFKSRAVRKNFAGHVYPQRIIPWTDFPARQEAIWKQLSGPSFASQHQFLPQVVLDEFRSSIERVGSDNMLKRFVQNTVELAVNTILYAVYENPLLRDRLGLQGKVEFDGMFNQDHPAGPLEHFCIHKVPDGHNIVLDMVYKTPHKLMLHEILSLKTEIQPERDVIDKNVTSVESASKSLAAAAITELFAHMVARGVQFGFVTTGQAYIFLHIPDDPTVVYCHVHVPYWDVRGVDEASLLKTAVAQVTAFALQSLRRSPPPQSWYDAAAKLKVWATDYDHVLARIPQELRGLEAQADFRKAHESRHLTRSPIPAPSDCNQADTESGCSKDNVDEGASSLSTQSICPDESAAVLDSGGSQAQADKGPQPQDGTGHQRIQDRPYCTHACLLGLAYGGPVDKSCPNAASHGPSHIDVKTFRTLLRAQMAEDRGPEADVMPVRQCNTYESPLKVRLSAYGYTLLAKGVRRCDHECLQREEEIFDRLRSIQGKHVPVCLGQTDLARPYYYGGRALENILLLSWAGQNMNQCIKEISKESTIAAVTEAYTSIHELGVLLGHQSRYYIKYYNGAFMIVGMSRAKHCSRLPRRVIRQDSQSGKRRLVVPRGEEVDDFDRELETIKSSVLWEFERDEYLD
ncbi:hypothetical protein SEPCBS119000_004378 [Sporothrix epigloea]|uniref:Uncharacterized protein n=1 Tax=Sporothrix epigloea TaxID=1892477 RepID=A0ABP0DVU7_9PEZI